MVPDGGELPMFVTDPPSANLVVPTPRAHDEEADRSRDRAWIERIRSGDVEAFEALFRTYFPLLCVIVTRYLHSREAAEDLVQDLFLTLWDKRDQLEIRRSLRTYLIVAARNRALGAVRHDHVITAWEHAVAQTSSADDHLAPSADAMLLDAEFTAAVQRAIRELPERRRLIFLMSREDGLTYAEIAAKLGLSIKTVETQIGRALATLRERVQQLLS